MDSFTLADYIVEAYNLPKYLNKKHTFSTHDLVLALAELNSIKETAEFLSVTDNALEHILERSLRPYFSGKKPRTQKWRVFFLSLFELKICSNCKEVKEKHDFSIDKSKASGRMSWCRICDCKRNAEYREANPEKVKVSRQQHYLNNKAYYISKNALYRANKSQATPAWANLEKIKEIYINCPENMHVDHIYPLNSDWVCGLHNEFNLQYLSPEDNLKKSNKNIGQ